MKCRGEKGKYWRGGEKQEMDYMLREREEKWGNEVGVRSDKRESRRWE